MTPYRLLVAERKQRRRRGDDLPVPDSAIASLSSEWHVPGRIVLAAATQAHFTYYLPPSRDAALFLVASSPIVDRQWFYVIEANKPVYAYLDFDCDTPGAYTAATWAAAVQRCAVLFAGFVAATFLCPSNTDGWRFYDASTERKWSAHAHSRIVFASIADMREVAQRFCAWLRRRHAESDPLVAPLFFVSRRSPAACIVDGSVYTERPFRLPLNRKAINVANYLQPAYGTQPYESMLDEINAGFLHPSPDTPTLPPFSAIVAARRDITAALRPVGDSSAQVDAAIRAVWRGPADVPPIVQDPAEITPATRRALMSVAGGFIEAAALQLYRDAPLSEWDGRTQVLLAASSMVPDLVGVLADIGGIVNLNVCVKTTDFRLAHAFVALILRTHAWIAAGTDNVDAWLAAGECVLPDGLDVAAAFDALRRDAPSVLPVPENAVTLDCMKLATHSPFDDDGT